MSRHVADMIIRKRRELADTESQITPAIDSVLLIDRNVDLLTPLLTQLTYEGLIDEIFTIENTNVQLPADRFPVKDEGTGVGSSLLDSDAYFCGMQVLLCRNSLYM